MARPRFILMLKVSVAALIAFMFCPLSAYAADPAVGSLQPFSCNNSTATVINSDNRYIYIDGKAVSIVNVDGNAGYEIYDLPKDNVLSDSEWLKNSKDPIRWNALYITFSVPNPSVINNMVVRMCFKPQLGQPDLISFDKPLNTFKIEKYSDFYEAYATRSEIFAGHEGVPDLRKLDVILTSPGNAVTGKIWWGRTGIYPAYNKIKTIVMSNAGCDAGDPCSSLSNPPPSSGGGGSGHHGHQHDHHHPPPHH